eukprot:SAG31_NODE_41824_length_274_cov_0.731429_1_plen_78_part_01
MIDATHKLIIIFHVKVFRRHCEIDLLTVEFESELALIVSSVMVHQLLHRRFAADFDSLRFGGAEAHRYLHASSAPPAN